MNSVPTSLWEWLDKIGPDDRLPIVIVTVLFGLAATVVVMWVLAHTIAKIHRARLESNLKHELLERGLSAEEIAIVVASTAGNRRRIQSSEQ